MWWHLIHIPVKLLSRGLNSEISEKNSLARTGVFANGTDPARRFDFHLVTGLGFFDRVRFWRHTQYGSMSRVDESDLDWKLDFTNNFLEVNFRRKRPAIVLAVKVPIDMSFGVLNVTTLEQERWQNLRYALAYGQVEDRYVVALGFPSSGGARRIRVNFKDLPKEFKLADRTVISNQPDCSSSPFA